MTDVTPGWEAGTGGRQAHDRRCHVENGKITAIRVIFDPRPLTTPAAAGGGRP